MAYLDMAELPEREIPEARVYEQSRWVRAPAGQSGFFFPSAKLGDRVEPGDVLGRIVDPLTYENFEVTSPLRGEIVGRSVSQPVLSGYALFHVAWHDTD